MKNNIIPKNDCQTRYLESLESAHVILALGPAGTGKTYLATAKAAQMYDDGRVDKLLFLRPAVATESLGFLPGDLEEKMDPYMRPLFDALEDFWSPKKIQACLQHGTIEIVTLGYARGRTFKNCFIILDEAQNTTKEQMKLFLTRFGENVKAVITGDLSQSDLGKNNGLQWASQILNNCSPVKTVKFNTVVRSKLAEQIMKALNSE